MLALDYPAVVLGPEDAADDLADAIYLGLPLAVGLALWGVVCEVGQGDVQGLMAQNLQLAPRG
jgi:hypothetical protein